MQLAIDRLTGLPGRDLLDEFRVRFADRPREEAWTVMMIDIDQFKLINDAYGHLLGDVVLSEVGAALRKNLRSGDAVLRYGGDEFLAVFPATVSEGASRFAQRIITAISSLVLPHDLCITLSVGMAQSGSDDAALDAVLSRADTALYRAKREGRNRVVVFNPEEPEHPDQLVFSHFVGREQELRLLRQVLDQALEQGSRFAVVEGEIGVGKTRLTMELQRYGAFRGCLVARFECTEFGESAPYSFATSSLRLMLEALPEHEIRQVRRFVGPLHPSSASLLPGFDVAEQGQRFFSDEGLKFRVFEDILRVLRAITMFSPALMIIEDAQWLARHDLELLAYLVRAADDAPLLTVVTVQSEGDGTDTSSQFVSGLAQTVPSVRVALRHLEADEVASLLTIALRDPAMPFEVMGMLYRQSGGNPLFLLELLRALRDEGQIAPAEQGGWVYQIDPTPALPASLTQVIGRRLGVLSEPTRKLLRIASLAGGPFSLAMLVDVAGRPAMEVAEGLEEALKAGVIHEGTSEPEPTYLFVHDTVRSYVYRDLSQATKAVLHPRMGAFYERLYRDGHAGLIGATAYHYAEGGDSAKATMYALLAAKASCQRQAARETLRWLKIYVEHVFEETEPPEDLVYAYRTLGEFSSLTGEGEAAQRYLAKALDLAESADDRVTVLSRIGDNLQKLSMYPEAREHYEAALAQASDPVIRADLLVSVVYLDYLQGVFTDATARLDEVRTLLASAGQSPETRRVWAAYHKRMGDVQHEVATAAESLTHYQRSLELYREQGDRVGESAVLNNMSGCYSTLGDPERSLELLQEAARINAQIDDALGLAIAHYNLAESYGTLNQVGLARDYYQRYMATSDRIGNKLAMGYGHFGLGYLAWIEGDLRGAEDSYRASAEAFERLQTDNLAIMSRVRLAEVLLEGGRLVEGSEEIDRIRQSIAQGLATGYERDLLFLEGLHVLLTGSIADNPDMIRRMDSALAEAPHEDLRTSMRWAHVLTRLQEAQGNTDGACATLQRALKVVEQHLEGLTNHAYRSSLTNAREIRQVRDAFERATGKKWRP